MAQRRLGSSDRPPQRAIRDGSRHRRRHVMKPAGWPRYMVEKSLKGGSILAYYWEAHRRNGTSRGASAIPGEALGSDYATACERARLLNQHLDAWRQGRGAAKELDLQPGFGTLGWLVERYKRGRAWEKDSQRSRPDYDRAFGLVLGFKLRQRPRAALGTAQRDLSSRRRQAICGLAEERASRAPPPTSQHVHAADGEGMGRPTPTVSYVSSCREPVPRR